MASNLVAATNVSGRSFLDALAQASSSGANKPAFTVAASKGSSSDTPDHGSEDQTSKQPIAASENEAVDAQEISTAGSTIRKFAPVIADQQNQETELSRAVLTSGGPASSAHSQSQAKASQSTQNQVTDSIPQAGDQVAAQQIVASMPAVTLSEFSFGRSIQPEAASPTAAAKRPALPAVLGSNANSTAQTSQSTVPASASPAVTLSSVSFGRSMQWEAASPTASAELPPNPKAPASNANSVAQTGSDGADSGQSPVPASASPAVTLSAVSFSRSMQWEAASPTASAKRPALPAILGSNANSAAQTSQSPVPASASPAVTLSEVSIGRSMQWEAASPTASAKRPALPAILQSNANSIAQTGSNGADPSQSPVPASTSPAVTLSAVSFGRSIQWEAASPTASAELPPNPKAPASNANSVAQTGSNGADPSQSPVPASASPASADPSILAGASAAGLIEQSVFAVGNTFSPSTILPTSDGAGTLTDKASQFKSSGATFTVNSGDANSSKAASAQGSISADHSAQSGTPLSQHAPGDSSPATPLAVKPLEASVTQTIPVSNHTALASPSQPHAASSMSDVLIKAQDSADAAAEQLERAGSAAAAGISTARLIQSMSESEMRVGMHSAEFGDISIRTSVSQQQLMAQISVDHGELGSAIAAHLPSLASKLGGEFGLHTSIEVNQLGGSVTGGNGQSSQQNQKMTPQSVPPDSSALNAEDDRMPLPGQSLEVEDSRLDIRA
jgi:hypothetical protein